ncbi:MAG: hypothetical protein ACREJ3_06615, partial [Polyangiaceae bacterium]
LLWSPAAAPDTFPTSAAGLTNIALWTLGDTASLPYSAVDVLSLNSAVQAVDDVPFAPAPAMPKDQLKVLELPNGLAVLDLTAHTVAPLSTTVTVTLNVARDGARMWAYAPGGTSLTAIGLPALTLTQLTTQAPISSVYDVARQDGTRALIALHAQGTWGATVFDALSPSVATARRATSLLLEAQP